MTTSRYDKMTTEHRTRRGVWRVDDVFQASYDRVAEVYKRGDRVVVAISGGKDSTVMMELCVMVARDLGMLPVEAVMRDEEIMYPGTYEYLHRVANRSDEIDLHWVIAGQPVVNAYDRFNPYWWVFDPLEEHRWVRGYPGHGEPEIPRPAYWLEDQELWHITGWKNFPLKGYRGWEDWDDLTPRERLRKAKKNGWPYNPEVAQLMNMVGVRSSESRGRYLAVLSMGGWTTGCGVGGNFSGYPIFDWNTPDVWKFIRDFGLDYNEAYDVMTRYGMRGDAQRIAPPTFAEGVASLKMASNAWPQWWDRLCNRVGGMRRAAQFGKAAIAPRRDPGQTWEEVYRTELITDRVPEWIRERAQALLDRILSSHAKHSSGPFPEEASCPSCTDGNGSWKQLVHAMWDGDPFSKKNMALKAVHPEVFREGAGRWEQVARDVWKEADA